MCNSLRAQSASLKCVRVNGCTWERCLRPLPTHLSNPLTSGFWLTSSSISIAYRIQLNITLALWVLSPTHLAAQPWRWSMLHTQLGRPMEWWKGCLRTRCSDRFRGGKGMACWGFCLVSQKLGCWWRSHSRQDNAEFVVDIKYEMDTFSLKISPKTHQLLSGIIMT